MHRTLGEALDLDADQGVWYIFRDRISNLEFLRRGAELAYEGFATHLNGYESRALVDFRRVHDSQGRWHEVADLLQGGGTPDVSLAVRRLELAPQLASLKICVQADVLAALEWPLAEDSAATPLAAPALNLPSPLQATVTGLQQLRLTETPPEWGPQSRLDLAELLAAVPGSRILQAIYLRDLLATLPGGAADRATSVLPWAGLDPGDRPLVVSDLKDALIEWTGHGFAGGSTVALAELLLISADSLTAMAQGRVGWFSELVKAAEARIYLGINEHQGREFLRQEALITFMQAMVLCGLRRAKEPNLSALLDAQALILEAAQRAQYDLGDTLKRLTKG